MGVLRLKNDNRFDGDPRPASSGLELTRTLAPVSDRQLLKEIHHYRISYEAANGATPRNREYVTQYSAKKQAAIWSRDPIRYLRQLPPFFKSFCEYKCRCAADLGRLDDFSAPFIRAFVSNKGKL
jgi:hypothetical protein